jgi:flagellar biosynthesis anti-sigma factor FlgM
MKVEQHGPVGHAPGVGPASVGEAPPASSRASGAAPGSDQLTLSADVQTVQNAFERALAAPEIRADVVARMKALDDAGELGRDATRLADAMIDHWLTTPEKA